MVALLTKLKWRLWKGGYAQDRKRIIVLVLGLLYALPMLAALLVGIPVLGWFAHDWAVPVIVVIGALGLLLWTVIPLASFGVDDTLAPVKFAHLPVRAARLQPGLFAAAFVSVPALCTVLGVVGLAIGAEVALARGDHGAAGIAAMVLTPIAFGLGLVLCLLMPRTLMAATSVGGVSRRRRELGGIVFVVGMLVVLYGTQILLTAEADRLAGMDLRDAVARVGMIAGWTPLGAPFALPFHVAEGRWLSALGAGVITVVAVVGFWLWWRHALERTLVTGVNEQGGGAARKLTGSFIPRFYPTSVVGAVAGRSLRYWLRDNRYLTSLVIMPIVGVVMLALGGIQGTPMVFLAPLMMAWGAIALADDFGYDGPAMWVNATAGLDPRANLMGRGVAAMTLIVPGVLIFAVAASAVYGRPDLIWPTIGAGLGITGTLVGMAAVMCVVLPYPIKAPGASAMSGGASGTGASAFLSAFAAMFGLFIPLIPAAVLYILGFVLWPWMLWIAPLVAVATGYLMLRLGWHFGARLLARREPEVFAVVRNWAK